MHSVTRLTAALVCLASLLLGGCLTSEPPLAVRYFKPATVASSMQPLDDAPAVAIDTVGAATELGAPMMWTTSAVEVGFDEMHQWAAPPADFVRDALRRTIYGSAGFGPLERGPPGLVVYVERFGGDQPAGVAVVELRLRLRDVGDRIRQGRIVATSPLADLDPETLATAIGEALQEAVDRTARWLGGEHAP